MELFKLKGVNGQLTIYEDKVVIERKGALGLMNHGLAGAKTIPMHSIHSIQFKEGNNLTNGFIQFGILGGNESKGGVFNATKDENTVMIKKSQNAVVHQIKEYIEERIIQNSKPANTIQQVSAADEILKLKSLLDAGIITQEEFDAKKNQLLGL